MVRKGPLENVSMGGGGRMRGGVGKSLSIHVQCIQVFRERLSEKVHATTPKGIVGSFECPVLQRNLKELHGRPRTYVCEC